MKDKLKRKRRIMSKSDKTTTFLTFLFLMMISFLLIPACSTDKGDSLTRIRNTGQISFAMSGAFPPFSFYTDKNELVGFDVDVAREVAKRLGVKVKIVTTEWSSIIQGLRSGDYDGILGSMAVTEERLKLVVFSVPYYYTGAQLMVRANAFFKSPADLKGRTIGVVGGTTYENDAKLLGASRIRLYSGDNQTIHELHKGVLDGAITDKVVGSYLMNCGQFDIKRLGVLLRSENIAVAFRKEDVALLKKVNKILETMRKDGSLDDLLKKVNLGGYNCSK
jgi:polar amino acid transport system substrate-binding protein